MAMTTGSGLSMADLLRLLSQGSEPGSYQSELATVANQAAPGQSASSSGMGTSTNKGTSADTATPSVAPLTTPMPGSSTTAPAPSAASDALSASLNVPSVPNVGLLATQSPSFSMASGGGGGSSSGGASNGSGSSSGSNGVSVTPQQAQTINSLGGMYSHTSGGLMSPKFGSSPTSAYNEFGTPSFSGSGLNTGSGGGTTSSGGSSTPNFYGITLGDVLGLLGGIGSGVANYNLSKSQLAQQAAEFAKQYGLATGEAALQAKSQLNRAPLADKGQYLALNAAAPTPFQPRDYTNQGLNATRGSATGGAAQQLAANAITANSYKPGMGGVDTSTLQQFLKSLGYG
jgi:hypothetical protein